MNMLAGSIFILQCIELGILFSLLYDRKQGYRYHKKEFDRLYDEIVDAEYEIQKLEKEK